MSYISATSCHLRNGERDGRSTDIEQARTRFRSFHACPPAAMVTLPCRRTMPKLLVQLGSLRGLIYSADRGDGGVRTYIHFMERAPLLACNAPGTQLYIVGGRYRITRRGIEG